MWLFVDESWAPAGCVPAFGVLLGVLLRDDQLERLEDLQFAIRKKYYGPEHARDLRSELKGKDLLSNYVLRMWRAGKPLPRNLCVVRELIAYPRLNPDFYLRLFASTVYSADPRPPELLSPDPKKLAEPFRHLVQRASQAAAQDAPDRSVTLVFDQRLGAQRDIGIAVRNFVVGMALPNVHRYPYFAVSNVSPGVQLADVFAHLLSKRAQKVRPVMSLYNEMKDLQWESKRAPRQYGFVRLNEVRTGGEVRYRPRRSW